MTRTPTGPMGFWLPLALAAAPVLAWQDKSVDDQVRLKNGVTLTGRLLRWDERGVALRDRQGKVLERPTADIDVVVTPLLDAHRLGDVAAERANHDEALRAYAAALEEETRDWALQRIRLGMVKACAAVGSLESAVDPFLALAKDRDDAELMAFAPLVWLPGQTLPEAASRGAGRMLIDESPMARLIGASWLLDSPRQADAVAALRVLDANPDNRVRWLARAQLWRHRAGSASKADLAELKQFLAELPETLRAGPNMQLGLAHEHVQQWPEAALAYLWTALVYAPRTPLAADAMARSAAASLKAGFKDDARTLWRAIVRDYPDTPWAEQAKQRLAGSEGSGS